MDIPYLLSCSILTETRSLSLSPSSLRLSFSLPPLLPLSPLFHLRYFSLLYSISLPFFLSVPPSYSLPPDLYIFPSLSLPPSPARENATKLKTERSESQRRLKSMSMKKFMKKVNEKSQKSKKSKVKKVYKVNESQCRTVYACTYVCELYHDQ